MEKSALIDSDVNYDWNFLNYPIHTVSAKPEKTSKEYAILLIHGFGASVFVDIAPESILASTVGEAVESRNLNRKIPTWMKKAGAWGKWAAEQLGGAAFWGETWGEIKDWFGSDDAPSGCKRRSLLMMGC